MLPAASSGLNELMLLAALRATPDLMEDFETQVMGLPNMGTLIRGGKAPTPPSREKVPPIRKHLRETYRQTQVWPLEKGGYACAVVWRDYKGYPQDAWKDREKWNKIHGEELFTDYTTLLEAIHLFDAALGLTLRQRRGSALLGPILEGFRNAPTQVGAWYKRGSGGDKIG